MRLVPSQFLFFIFFIFFFKHAWANQSEWVVFDDSNGLIEFPVLIEGVEANALLDTGATGFFISESFLQKNDIQVNRAGKALVSGAYGNRKTDIIKSVSLTVFGFETTIKDLIPNRSKHFDIILGEQFLRNFIFTFDYPNHRLKIRTRDSLDLRKYANVDTAQYANGITPLVKVTIDDTALWVLFDTGNSHSLLIKRHIAESKGWLKKDESHKTISQGIIEKEELETFTVKNFQIGPYQLTNVLVSVGKDNASTNLGKTLSNTEITGSTIERTKDEQGILGYDILKHFYVTVDLEKRLINLSLPPE